jgi:AraC-like DNA-binding protein
MRALSGVSIPKENAIMPEDQARKLCKRLTSKIVSMIGTEQNRATAVRALTLHRRVSPTAPCSMTYQPGITLMVQGEKRVELGGESYIYGEGAYLLTSLDLPIVSQIVKASEERPCVALSLRLEIPTVRELLAREEIAVAEAAPTTAAMITGTASVELLDACRRLLQLLDSPQDVPFLSDLIEREIIYRILRGPEGARLRAIATIGDQSHRTSKAIAWLRSNFAKSLRIEELAEIAGMGVSTLHHHFRALTRMSPLQYQKQLRLQAARARMLADGLDAATAAFEVGYESASQFNREYSRLFGQPPMRNIKTLRSPNAPELEFASRV